MPKGGCSKTPQPEDFSLSNDMVEKQTGKKDKDKVSLTKTPKLDRSDGGKEVKERATKRKLPFTVGTNGDQKDSDTALSVDAFRCLQFSPCCGGIRLRTLPEAPRHEMGAPRSRMKKSRVQSGRGLKRSPPRESLACCLEWAFQESGQATRSPSASKSLCSCR
uniref:Ankyrin repeat domain-containing protein 11 n=1 Tax=Anas zonorhyncha TaxID=75864 RepID=A0A8B9U267_9AVES